MILLASGEGRDFDPHYCQTSDCRGYYRDLTGWKVKLRTVFAAALAALTTCVDTPKSNAPHGEVIVIAALSDADVLFPPLVNRTISRQVTELVYDYLTEVSPSLNTFDDKTFATRLARSWDWSRDSLSLAVHLHPNARWHDGKPVSADDVAYTFSIYTNKRLGSSTAPQLSNIDSVTVADSLTAVFWFSKRYPLQFYDATSQMQILPRHVFGSIRPDSLREAVATIDPVGSGRYRYVRRRTGESIELAADTSNYRGSPKIDRLIWRIFESPDRAAQALLAGEVDVYDGMRPENVNATANHESVRTILSPGSDYVFMIFNLQRSLFSSREMRRALTMIIDRAAMTRNVFDSLAQPAIGPTISSFPTTDPNLRQIPYDTVAARSILDSLGWRVDNKTNVRTKNGRELRFRILVPTSSANRMKMALLAQEQFRKSGVAVDLDQMDYGAFTDRLYRADFETAMHNWHLGTSPASVRTLWTSEAAGPNGNNLGAYKSRAFDADIDSAVTTLDPARSRMFYNRAYQTAIDDAPAIWLYEPKLSLGIQKRIHTEPYRPDAWWYSLSDWSISGTDNTR